MYALTNCDIYTGHEVICDRDVVVKEGLVVSITSRENIGADIQRVDLGGRSIAPGFIDLQVNGGGGVLFNDDPTVRGISTIVEGHRRFGTTSILPTLITSDRGLVSRALGAVEEYCQSGLRGVLGVHLEGPLINADKAGVHDKRFISELEPGDLNLFSRLVKSGCSTLVTLAPEVVPQRVIADLVSRGVLVSAGHTNATFAEMSQAATEGLSCVTHLFNAMSQLGSREAGAVGAALDAELAGISAGVIADGFHVSFPSLRVAWQAFQAKRTGQLFLVTDAMPVVGSSVREFRLGQYEIELRDGKLTTSDGTLAGSALDMASAVRNCVQKVGIPKDEALRMASTYQAQFLGVDTRLGRIAPGFVADFAVFNNEIAVSAVVVHGDITDWSKRVE